MTAGDLIEWSMAIAGSIGALSLAGIAVTLLVVAVREFRS